MSLALLKIAIPVIIAVWLWTGYGVSKLFEVKGRLKTICIIGGPFSFLAPIFTGAFFITAMVTFLFAISKIEWLVEKTEGYAISNQLNKLIAWVD